MRERIATLGANARYDETYRIVRPNGEIRWILDRGFPVIDQFGECAGVTGVAIDITQEKKHEEALLEAKEKAEAANKAKSAFIANMSHDLRTPLSGVIGLAQIHQHQVQDNTTQEVLSSIIDAGEQLMCLVDEILEASSLEMDQDTLYQKNNFYSQDLIDALEKTLQPAATHKQLLLHLHTDPNMPVLYGADRIIHRILMNPASNAIKFTAKGKVDIAIKLIQKKPLQLQLIVTDTGIGIPEAQQQQIFEKFERLTPAYEANYPGSGLGLYLVKQFIEALNGTIDVVSKPNKGSTFTVNLPVELGQANAEHKPTANNSMKEVKFSVKNHTTREASSVETSLIQKDLQSKHFNILIVEDDALAQCISKTVLEQFLGAEVTVAGSSKEACKKVETEKFDLIFMDIGLPDRDGMVTTNFIRTNPNRNQSTPIIALSAHINDTDKARCLKAGMQGILSKPLTREKAHTVMQTWVNENLALKKTVGDDFKSSGNIVLDLAKTAELLGLTPNEVKPYYELLLKALMEDKPAIVTAYRKQDWSALRGRLHRMEGGFAYCKAPCLEKCCISLHNAVKGREMDTKIVKTELELFLQALDQAVSAIRELGISK